MTKSSSIPLSSSDISETLTALETLMNGGQVKNNPNNPLLSGIMASFEDDAIPGYKRGREYTEAELRGLPPSSMIWIQYRKDDHGSLRFNGAYEITSYDADDPNTFYVHSGDEWPLNGDTSRGTAHYFVAEPAEPAKKKGVKKKGRK